MRVGYVILFVSDLEASIAFYRDVVGLPLRFSEEGYAEFATEGARLGLYERTRLPDLIGRASEAGGEVVLMVEDVDGEAARLQDAGATILAGPTDRPWGHRTLHLSDPEGHVVELAQEIPRAAPRRRPS